MAIAGSGTQADPFVVHNYTEFISLSEHSRISGTEAVYIKWFDTPGQTLNCNDYGSEFTWDEFTTKNPSSEGSNTFYIDLNGATIKNFIIAPGKTMFNPKGYAGGYTCKIEVYNGSFRNVFMGSATSKFCGDYVKFHDVSLSINTSGCTENVFYSQGNTAMDNCALYLVSAKLTKPIMYRVNLSDTDIELYVNELNQCLPFEQCELTGCRIQGKLGGTIKYASNQNVIFGQTSGSGALASLRCPMTNCVVDVDYNDITISNPNYTIVNILREMNPSELNTTVFCNTHLPIDRDYVYPTLWNYMTHEQIRNGEYLNSKGFTVVEVVGG